MSILTFSERRPSFEMLERHCLIKEYINEEEKAPGFSEPSQNILKPINLKSKLDSLMLTKEFLSP